MNILVIDAWLPTPDRDGGSLRMFNLLGVLRDLGATVTFAAEDFRSRASAVDSLRAAGIRLVTPPEVDLLAGHLARHGSDYDIVLLARVAQATKYLPVVRKHAPRARVIFDTIDLHYLRLFRGAKATSSLNLLRQALETKRDELAAVSAADVTLVVSSVEQEILELECPEARVHVVSNIHAVSGSARPFGGREGIVFVGAFPHHPNADAMRHFFTEVYPLLMGRLGRVPVTIIGSNPPAWLQEYASETVRVTGHVRDIAPYLHQCRLTIAPLRYGAGVKGKVLASMSFGVPVVLTSIAAEGIPCRDRLDVLLADDPNAFAEAVCELHRDEQLWNTLSENGLELVRKHFSAEVARREMAKCIHKSFDE